MSICSFYVLNFAHFSPYFSTCLALLKISLINCFLWDLLILCNFLPFCVLPRGFVYFSLSLSTCLIVLKSDFLIAFLESMHDIKSGKIGSNPPIYCYDKLSITASMGLLGYQHQDPLPIVRYHPWRLV